MNDIEIDMALEKWAREMSEGGPGGYASVALDGNLALAETRGYRRGRNPMMVKESRRVGKQEILISTASAKMDGIMLRIKNINGDYYRALLLSYQRPNMKAVAAAMGVGYGHARQLRSAAFDMVKLLVDSASPI